MGCIASYQPPTRLHATYHHSLDGVIQPAFNLFHCPLMQPVLHQLTYEDLTGSSVKSLTEVKVDNIHCFPLIHQASDFIIDGDKVGQACHGESMLTTPDDLIVLHMPGNDFWD